MRSIRSFSTTLAVALAAALVLSACGGADDTPDAADDSPSMSESMDDAAADDHESFAFGEPADEADADRTIEVEALDSLAYDPPTIEVAADETVTFVVSNTGSAVHEFVIGDAEVQEEHEVEMQEMGDSDMPMGDEPNALVLEAGETKSITWHFTEAGELEFACHQPGHYAGGMTGTFAVS